MNKKTWREVCSKMPQGALALGIGTAGCTSVYGVYTSRVGNQMDGKERKIIFKILDLT
ncbi:hypothetical protein [Nostoc sp.]|uniref:hypothetical protein n=1 Tax=Nostoc sp. TaxID=1180 RepID=UPI002FFA9E9B